MDISRFGPPPVREDDMQTTAEYREFLKKKMGWQTAEQPGSDLRDTDEYEERVYARDRR